jgi:hypothetical protein
MLNINSNQVTHLLDRKGLEEHRDYVYPICSPDRRTLRRTTATRVEANNNNVMSGARYGWGNENNDEKKQAHDREQQGEEESKYMDDSEITGNFATLGNFDSSHFQIPSSVMSELSRNNQYTSPTRELQQQSRNSNNSDYQLKSPQRTYSSGNGNDENNYVIPESHPQSSPSPRRRASPNRQMGNQQQPQQQTSPWRRRRTHDNFGRRDPFADNNNNSNNSNRGIRQHYRNFDQGENTNPMRRRRQQQQQNNNNENMDSRFEDENITRFHNNNRNNVQYDNENHTQRNRQQQHQRNRPSLHQRLRPFDYENSQ